MTSEDVNSTVCSMRSSCWEREIAILNDSYAKNVIFVIVFMVVVLVVGIVGNIVLLIVYSKKKNKTSSDYLIIVLGYIDLLACLFVHPYMTYKLVYFYLQDWGWVCKLFEFLAHLNLACSVAVFIAIAVDRFYAVCKPLKFLRSLKLVKILLAVLLPVGVGISLPVLEFVGVRMERVDTLDGARTISTARCHYQHRYNDSLELTVFRVLLAGFFLVTVVLISALYSRVAFTAYRRTRGRVLPSGGSGRNPETVASKAEMSVAPKQAASEQVESEQVVSEQVNESREELVEEPRTANATAAKSSSVKVIVVQSAKRQPDETGADGSLDNAEGKITLGDGENVASDDNKTNEVRRQEEVEKKSSLSGSVNDADASGEKTTKATALTTIWTLGQALRLKKRGRKPPPQSGPRDQAGSPPSSALRTAKMLFVVTAAFFVSWSPYWVLVVLTSLDAGFWQPRSGGEVVLERLLTHLFYLNNSVNPIIYAVFNRQFRSDSLRLLRQCCPCCWRK